MVKIYITCTQPRADAIAADLAATGSFDAVVMPALQVISCPSPQPQGGFEAMLVTSAHAFEAGLPDLPVIAVGEMTAAAAVHKGFTVIQTGNGGIDDLDLSGYDCLLYPCAAQPTAVPANAIPWTVYETVPAADFDIPDEISIVCLFSVRGAAHYCTSCFSRQHKIICLSERVAQEAGKHKPSQNLAVCKTPSYDSLKQLIKDLYDHDFSGFSGRNHQC